MRDRPDELVVRVDTERGQSGALSAIRPSREAHEQRQIRASSTQVSKPLRTRRKCAPWRARVGRTGDKATHVCLSVCISPCGATVGAPGGDVGVAGAAEVIRQAQTLLYRKLSINNERSFRQLRAAGMSLGIRKPAGSACPARQTAYWRRRAGVVERSGIRVVGRATGQRSGFTG